MWAVLPVKDLANAKQRLAATLSAAERGRLSAAMLEDVLAALARVAGLDGILVVSRDREAAALARRYGARLLQESENLGHTAAVAEAAKVLRGQGAGGMMQVPGDVPLAIGEEFARVLAAHGPAPALTIVPSHDDRGSNCIACSPPGAVPLRFGDDSFLPHLQAARRHGIEPRVLRLPGLGLDIDRPADLRALLDRAAPSRTRRYLEMSGIAARLDDDGRAPIAASLPA
jgi:2-phospho-L-lactate guanylyltransferase